jgi:voltage-gated potassium channel Kch
VAGITIGVMLIKGMVLFGIAKIFRVKIDQNLIFTFYLAQVGEFAFVLLSFSSQEGILDQEIINILMAVTAISMALTPLFMLLNERRILPFVGTKEKPEPQADAVDEQNAVIIAGFGRFGNIVGRFLWANGINATVLDNDSDRVEVLRKLGLKVYYGDASRLDLLESAGIAKAKMVIAAMDGPGKNVELADILKKHYPDVYVLARADDRSDAYELMDAGLLKIYRETLDTSLRLGVDALTLLGHRAYRAQRAARIFLKHDEKAMKQLAALRFDRDKYMNFAKDRIAEMEELLMADLRERELHDDSGWDDESLRKEVKAGNFIK